MMKSMSTSLFSKSDASPFASNRASKVGTGCGRALPSSMGYLGFRGLTPQATQLTQLTQLTQGVWDGIIFHQGDGTNMLKMSSSEREYEWDEHPF